MDLLNAEIRDITRKKFECELAGKVTLLFFTQEPTVLVVPNRVPGLECQFCRETRQLLEEVKSLSDRIDLQVFDFVTHKEKVAEFGIDKIPATVVLRDKDHGIRFYGIPSGYVYTSLVEATEFPHLAQKYTVYGVPKTVINETVAMNGAVPEEVFLANVLKAAGQENA